MGGFERVASALEKQAFLLFSKDSLLLLWSSSSENPLNQRVEGEMTTMTIKIQKKRGEGNFSVAAGVPGHYQRLPGKKEIVKN